MTAAEIASLELEGVNPIIAELIKSDYTLESSFKNTKAKQVGTRAYRLVMKYARPGHAAALNLDGGTLALGSATKFNNGSITPFVYHVPTNFTELVKLVGVNKEAVAIKDVVSDIIADVAKQVRNWNDIMLQTAGKGYIGTVAAVNTGASPKNYTLTNNFGARLLGAGLTVDVVNPSTDVARGSVLIDQVLQFFGTTQSFQYSSTDVPGATANDLLRLQGLTDGAPVAIYGLPYFLNTSQTGTLLGITKASAPYVVANGFDMGASQITQPALRALINAIQTRLEGDPMAGGFWHTHRSQVASYEELGFALQTIPMASGQAPSKLDLFFGTYKSEGFSVCGFPIKINDHADNAVWDFVQPDSWGRVMYGEGPFWYPALPNSKIYPLYDGSTGTPKTQFGAAMVVPQQFYTDNVLAQGRISNCGLPILN
jgi:hypothetical protein